MSQISLRADAAGNTGVHGNAKVTTDHDQFSEFSALDNSFLLCSTADGTGYSRRTDTTHESNLNVRHAALITNFPIYIACLLTLCMTHEMYLTNTTVSYIVRLLTLSLPKDGIASNVFSFQIR